MISKQYSIWALRFGDKTEWLVLSYIFLKVKKIGNEKCPALCQILSNSF